MAQPKGSSVYARLPVSLQNVCCSLKGLWIRRQRHNRAFYHALEFLAHSQWWPLERQRDYQDQKLQQLVRHAYDTVPYYHEVMVAGKLKPEDIRTVDDLAKLPVLEKQTVRERFDDLLSRGWPERRVMASETGGTTGTALKLAMDVDTVPWQWAVWWRHRQRFGLRVHEPFVVFAGRYVVPLQTMSPPIWRRNLPMHQTYVSVHHLTRQNMAPLTRYLQKRRVRYYSGYPSALYLFASYLLDQNVRLNHPPRITTTGAETLLPHQRRVIEEAFETEVADQYGATEACGNISECEKHVYHVDMEFGIVEFLPIEGLPSHIRRIVCTALHNPVMPLIRYNIGDIATMADTPCPCGRAAPVVARIDGRIESYIITPDGRQLGRLDFLFKKTKHIKEAQLYQDRLDHVLVRIVPAPAYVAADQESLLREMRTYVGDEIRVDVQLVDDIPREANGKFRQIVSKVFVDKYAEYTQAPASRSD